MTMNKDALIKIWNQIFQLLKDAHKNRLTPDWNPFVLGQIIYQLGVLSLSFNFLLQTFPDFYLPLINYK